MYRLLLEIQAISNIPSWEGGLICVRDLLGQRSAWQRVWKHPGRCSRAVCELAQTEEDNAVDWIGGTGITIVLFAFTFALVGWSQPYIGVIIAVSAILIAVFVFRQMYLEDESLRRPLVKVSIFKSLRMSAAVFCVATLCAGCNNRRTSIILSIPGSRCNSAFLRFIRTGVAGGQSNEQTRTLCIATC